MAAVMSSKRPRALTGGIDSVSGVGRHSRNKRSRRDTADSSENSSIAHAPSDDEASDHEGEHVQEIQATQQMHKDFEATANKQNVATDSGIIEEIQCVNFMCHEHLTVTLGPLINFIIGHNGSGKSAVLTALQICLGGKATATNRAQNLKSLIKEGKDQASVTVRIKNQGPLAFKPLQYGDSIIVERHFNKSGTSGFKIKDRNGKIVSTKKAELEDILDAHSLQIDNPMNVLTQDMARQFLNSSTPKDKYKFFLQGTNLENLSRDYQQIEQSLEAMFTKVEVQESDLKILRERMEKGQKKARLAQSLEKLRAKETEVAHQATWASVVEEEDEFENAVTEVNRVNALIQKRSGIVNEVSDRFEQADRAHEAAQEAVNEIILSREPADEAVQDAKAMFEQSRQKITDLKADMRKSGLEVEFKDKELKKYQAEIEHRRRQQTEAHEGVYAEKVRELQEAKENFERAKDAFTSHNDQLSPLREKSTAAQKERTAADQQMAKVREDERRLRSGINGLRGGQRSWSTAYRDPSNLEKLVQAISSDNSFREKPVGPMGRYVKLLNPEWAYILEKQFGQALNGFVVTNKADQNKLSALMRRFNWSSPVYIGSRTPIDTSRNEPEDPSRLTWLRALRFDNDLVRNQCIINQAIEQTLLVEDREEGLRLMQARGTLVKNVRTCLTFADGNKRKGRHIAYTSSGGINDSPIDGYTFPLRMQVDKEKQIREEQARLDQVQQELQILEKNSRDLLDKISACRRNEQNHETQIKRLRVAKQRAAETVDRLEGELSDATPDAAAIEVAEDALASVQAEMQRLEGLFDDAHAAKENCDAEARVNKNHLTSAQAVVQDLVFKLNKAQSTVRELQGQREDALKQKNHAIAQVTAAQNNKTIWEAERDEAQKKVDVATEKAQRICPERVQVPAGKSAEDLGVIFHRLVATREAAEKDLGGSQDELLRQANEAKRDHQEKSREFADNKNLQNHLINTLNHRRDRWKQFRSGISVRARVTFSYLLSERRFRGTLSIDHKKSLLDIHVQPDSMEKSGDERQTKTLSGGEKSYSTVCLLLALWDAMGSPIRCLDEFDVFMDSVNREKSMLLIIEAARRSIGRQFIFITPQSMNNVNQASDVKIIKMSDPERGQTALNVRRT